MALIQCKECKKEMSNQAQKCPSCGYPMQSNQKNKDTTVALILSILIPGVGQIYNGQVGKGICLMLSIIFLFCLSFFIFPPIIGICLWVWSIIDAYKIAKNSKFYLS